MHCAECGMSLTNEPYGSYDDGRKLCYSCCGRIGGAEMIEDGATVLYLSHEDRANGCKASTCSDRRHWKITNWPGNLVFRALQVSHSHQWFSPRGSLYNVKVQRTDAWFVGPDHKMWWAVVKGDMELARCKRIKRIPNAWQKAIAQGAA